jgi:hypothetical protein
MFRFLSYLLLTAVLVAGPLPAAKACINDRESTTHEKEFKSDYLRQPAGSVPTGPGDAPAPALDNIKVVGISGLGVALLVTGMVAGTWIAVRRR